MTAYWFSSADVVDEATQACYDSPEYQEALAFAKKAVVRDVVIVEGGVNGSPRIAISPYVAAERNSTANMQES